MLIPGMQTPLHVALSLESAWVSEHFLDVFCWCLRQPHSGKLRCQLTVLSLGCCMISRSQLDMESGCAQSIQLDIDGLQVNSLQCWMSQWLWGLTQVLDLSLSLLTTSEHFVVLFIDPPNGKSLLESMGNIAILCQAKLQNPLHKYALSRI